ncbi:MAG TPA: ATP synthase F1 subunit gamma [Candidatus Saccharimonadales bacterium]|nr:ATP synthase F1 subunit gamma [Candidatus Saccharimonadales bacterium]
MPSTITLKRRVSSVKNTKQITKAMELVSASKMRRAQDRAKLSRDYRRVSYDLLARLANLQETARHPLFQKRTIKARLYLVITSDSGLAGAYNYNVLKRFTTALTADRDKRVRSDVVVIGKQGANFARRIKDINLVGVYPAFGDAPTANDIRPILNTVTEQYQQRKVDEVVVIYTTFISNLTQQVTNLPILPADVADADKPSYKYGFTNFEPDADIVVERTVSRLIEVQIWQALLESMASEHSMRMLAMKNATDNASDIIDELTLELNTVRQANITQELAEISGGVEALKD